MKCQRCNKNEATNHITEIINGHKHELHLCSECAAKSEEFQGIKSGFDLGIGDFLGGIFGGGKQNTLTGETNPKSSSVCPVCGMPFEDFLRKGRLGCGDCYLVFRNRLERPLRQIHGTCEHVGKVPNRKSGAMMIDRKISQLEAQLNSAILKQEFEKAAELRDEINELKNNQSKEA